LVDIDERMPFPDTPMDAYNETKSIAETLVLKANKRGKGGLKTIALRPAGIFGPGDRQLLTHVSHIAATDKAKFILGDNNNLFDWTYVENVAWAHVLASDRLAEVVALENGGVPDAGVFPKEHAYKEDPPILPCGLTTTTSSHRIPTSLAKPLGPAINPTKEELEAAHAYANTPWPEPRPIVRNKYDQLSEHSLSMLSEPPLSTPEDEQEYPLQIPGQAFFITNTEPLPFWSFMRSLQYGMGYARSVDPKRTWYLPKGVAMFMAGASEVVGMILRREMTFTRFRVTLACASRWYNVEKARRVLGYEARVGVDEGVKKTVKVCSIVSFGYLKTCSCSLFSGGMRKVASYRLLANQRHRRRTSEHTTPCSVAFPLPVCVVSGSCAYRYSLPSCSVHSRLDIKLPYLRTHEHHVIGPSLRIPAL
jgi:sterol-4alpha-carboxylate 3-dehydrogenase (decarboxylating)